MVNKDKQEKEQDLRSETAKKFIQAFSDPVANLHTFSSCMELADLSKDGDYKLIIADIGEISTVINATTGLVSTTQNIKLKVFQGTSLKLENLIVDYPTGICSFYMDHNEPRVPALGVASGQHLFVYKNMRPYYKFTLPILETNKQEQDAWDLAKEGVLSGVSLRDKLESIRLDPAQDIPLSARTLRLLMMQSPDQIAEFVDTYKDAPIKRRTVITSICTLNKSHVNEDVICCVVMGTESGHVFILDPQAFTILIKFDLPSVPVFMDATGEYDVNFRINVICRNGKVYLLKKNCPETKLLIELSSQAVGLVMTNKFLMIPCMDDTLNCYSLKGKKLWSTLQPATILSIAQMDYKPKAIHGILVALENKEIRIYKDRFLVGILTTEHPVDALKFGRFGREDGALITVSRSGGLHVKLLRRVAQFEDKELNPGPPPEQQQRLNLPKKTKLFVDQAVRERECGADMYKTFQKDLLRIRLLAAKSFLNVLDNALMPVAANESCPLRLSAKVQGVGPMFKMFLCVHNSSLSNVLTDVFITFLCDESMYSVEKQLIEIPLVVPTVEYQYTTFIECLTSQPISDDIKVVLFKSHQPSPLVVSLVEMPVSEGLNI